MKQITILSIAILLFAFSASSQVTKGNWLFGGSINFSSLKASSDLGSSTETVIQINGKAGYFFIDKLVGGITPNIYFDKYKRNSGDNTSNRSSIGPFLRYYFLSAEQRVNLFAESSYAFGTAKVSNQNALHSNSFSFLGGPVFFLNSSVGLELSIGYTLTKSNDNANSKTNVIQAGIGLQYHLEKK